MSIYHNGLRSFKQVLLKSRNFHVSSIKSNQNKFQSYKYSNARYLSSSVNSISKFRANSAAVLLAQTHTQNGLQSRLYCSNKPTDNSNNAPASSGFNNFFNITFHP